MNYEVLDREAGRHDWQGSRTVGIHYQRWEVSCVNLRAIRAEVLPRMLRIIVSARGEASRELAFVVRGSACGPFVNVKRMSEARSSAPAI
jgi:hypothetical protein